ncbi:MAG: choice-of-anchor I family protein [Pseudomonadota bacterium]
MVDFDASTNRMFVTNDDQQQVDVIDVSDPTNPTAIGALDPSTALDDVDGISSVAVSDGLVAVAVPGETSGAVALYNSRTLALIDTFDVGFGPDMVTFTPDGATILVAIEAEPGDTVDNPGGVAIIDVATGTVNFAGFGAFDSVAGNLKISGVRLFPEDDTSIKAPSVDLEPEFITVTADGGTAFVSLQEANSIAVLDLTSGEFTEILPLGSIDHSQFGFGIDASDDDGVINIQNWPVQGLFMPDAIATYEVGGVNYIVTANEGDARSEDDRVRDLTLDPTAFPNAAELQQDENLGRLEVSTIDGDFDGDGDYDALFSYGTRSFTIFDEDGNLVFDSGSAFELIIAENAPAFHNVNNDDPTDFDTRSDNKGPEPEAIALGEIGGDWFAFIGMERATGIMVYNITDPAAPEFVQFINNAEVGDLGPETIRFVSAEDSPNDTPLLMIANEVSGTTAIYEIDVSPQAVTIMEVQGADHRSPLEGAEVTIEGVVTAIDAGEGFFIQDVNGDGDAATSDGIFIDDNRTDLVTVGDLVDITGVVDERQFGSDLSTTTIDDVTVINVQASDQPLPAAIILGPNGIVPPTGQIDDDGLTEFQPNEDGIDFFESLEGMLVTVEAGADVIGSNQFGETFLTVNADDGTRSVNGGLVLDGANGEITDANPERIIIDDDIYNDSGLGEARQPVPEATTGDSLGADVTGVFDYSFGEFKFLATDAPVISPGSTQEDITTLRATKDGDLTIATYNVLNLDPSDGNQFDELASDIVTNLGAPMIIALQEIQDNNGSTNDGTVAADLTYQALVDAIEAAGGPSYSFVDGTPVDGADGGAPGTNIRNGFLYLADEVTLQNTFRLEGDSFDPLGAFDEDPLPGDGINEEFAGTRKPFVGVFEVDGQEVTVVNNHFKSKRGDDPLSGAVQPPVEVTETQRVAQATVVNNYVSDLLNSDPGANVIVLGDLNDFEFSDPVLTLAGDELTNLMDTLDDGDRYTFNFNGNSQTLDHILVGNALAASAQVDAVHINADFPSDDRASDHDPVVALVNLLDVGGTDGDDILTASGNGGTVTPGQGQDVVILGAAGGNVVTGSLNELAGDVLAGFGDADKIVIEGQRLTADQISYDPVTGALNVAGNTLNVFGNDLDEGGFMITRSGNDSTITFVEAAASLAEGQAVDPADVTGQVNQAFLNGDNAQDFRVTLDAAGAAFDNLLGFYQTDAGGAITRAELLFDSVKDAGQGATADILDVSPGEDIGFFLVQNGGLIDFSGPLGLQESAGALQVTDGGTVLTDAVVFSSLNAELNPFDAVHVIAGPTSDASGLTFGFEDLVGGGDADYQDVTFNVSILNADPFAIV